MKKLSYYIRYRLALCLLLLLSLPVVAQEEILKLYPGFWSEKLIDVELKKIYYHDKIADKPLSGSYYWFPNEGQAWYCVEVTFEKGYPEGEAKFYKHGKLVSEATFREGVLDGMEYEYYSDGTIKRETFYIQAKKNGTEVFYRPNGQIEKEINFRNNIQDGRTRQYDQKGEIIKEEYYIHGVPDGKHWAVKNRRFIETNYQAGAIIEDTEYTWPEKIILRNTSYAFVDGKNVKNGEETFYTKEGILTTRNYYINGKDSLQIKYWENGAEKVKKLYRKGVLSNIYTFTPQKNKEQVEYFTNGKRTRIDTYHTNGRVAETKYYKNGRPTGDYKLYYSTGNIKEEVEGKEKRIYHDNKQLKSYWLFQKGRWVEVERYGRQGHTISID